VTPSPQQDEITRGGSPLIFGFLVKDGAASPVEFEAIGGVESQHDWAWLHFDAGNPTTLHWLTSNGQVPRPAARALIAPETRPRVTRFERGLVVNLRGVNLNEGAAPEDMVSIRIWIDEKRLISARLRSVKAAQDLRSELEHGARIGSPGALLARIAARLIDRMEPFLQEIEDEIDALEDAILQGGGHQLRTKLAQTRYVAVIVRRFIAPQREAVARLASEDFSGFDGTMKIDLREAADRVTRMTEDIDAARERAMVLQDQLTDQRAEEMNRNMMILSVVAAIFLPLGFLTGLFGINVGGMPGVEDPLAFWLVVISCVAVAVGLVALFKALKWL